MRSLGARARLKTKRLHAAYTCIYVSGNACARRAHVVIGQFAIRRCDRFAREIRAPGGPDPDSELELAATADRINRLFSGAFPEKSLLGIDMCVASVSANGDMDFDDCCHNSVRDYYIFFFPPVGVNFIGD